MPEYNNGGTFLPKFHTISTIKMGSLRELTIKTEIVIDVNFGNTWETGNFDYDF